MSQKLFTWIPMACIITCLCGLVEVTVQQSYRQNANDPQVQMSEDGESILVNVESTSYKTMPKIVSGPGIDITSLAPFVMYFDDDGRVVDTNLDRESIMKRYGRDVVVPPGVFNFTKEHGQNRITWQPYPDVRIATVITYFKGKGFVLAGRNLREVEKREKMLEEYVFTAWLVTMALSFVTCWIFAPARGKK